ncbi:MAG: kinase-like domain-containing protein [Piptocephalis tieghemiana]|nr:MAG: kinase-like domain-containing protein [Piptocephalis tieghemiana]
MVDTTSSPSLSRPPPIEAITEEEEEEEDVVGDLPGVPTPLSLSHPHSPYHHHSSSSSSPSSSSHVQSTTQSSSHHSQQPSPPHHPTSSIPHPQSSPGSRWPPSSSPSSSSSISHGKPPLSSPTSHKPTSTLTTAELDALLPPPPPRRSGYSLSDFDLLNTLGTGTFGRVYLCRPSRAHQPPLPLPSSPSDEGSVMVNSDEKASGGFYAMKVLKKSDVVRLRQVEHINSEKDILTDVRHPFIVNLHCTFQDETNLYMLLDYVLGGELFLHLRRAGRFTNEVTRFFASEILLAVEYLHARDIIYRDLKPENLLLDRDGHVKITDFGFAKRVPDRTWTLCGTPEYLAPEIIQSRGHGKAVDWWALGILIFEMLAGYPPFFDDYPIGIYEKILAGRIVFPPHFDLAAKDLVKRLLTADRTQRLGNLAGGAKDIRCHRWFREVNWAGLLTRQVRPPIQPAYAGPGDTGNFENYPEAPPAPAGPHVPDPYRGLFESF